MEQAQQPPKLARLTEDNFAALIRLFMSPANPKWVLPRESGGYAENTKIGWRHALSFAARPDTLGFVSLQEMRPSLVQVFFDSIAHKPGKQEVILTAMRQLEKWAIKRELLPRQITLGIEITRSTGGHIPWTDEQVAFGEANVGRNLSRAITLAANTGQRGGDIIRMGPTDIETINGVQGINVVQGKTRRVVWVPIVSTLAAAIETWERRPGPFLLRSDGRPWTRVALTNAWLDERTENPVLRPLRDAHLVLHGLRAHACVRLRRAGANTIQIAAMVGMSLPMVEHYCRFSSQRENAMAAVIHLERHLEKTISERHRSKSPRKA